MSASYKLDERINKNIVRNNTLMVNDNEKFDFVVYYKSSRTKQLIMKNNLIIKARYTKPWYQSLGTQLYQCNLQI